MAEIILDLSSIGGLTPNYHSYPEYEVANPNLNAFGADNQYANGTVNPFRRPGFLGPANNTATTITVTTNPATMFSATEVDSENQDIYFLGGGSTDPNLWSITSYTATAISTAMGAIGGSGVVGTDLQIYSLNGLRRLFYSYQ